MNRNIEWIVKLCLSFSVLPGISLSKKIDLSSKDSFSEKDLTRVQLFKESELLASKFNNLEEDQLQKDLRELIRPRIEDSFLKRNMNIRDLKGRIYYEIKGSSIKIFVLWNTNIYDEKRSYYDRLDLVL